MLKMLNIILDGEELFSFNMQPILLSEVLHPCDLLLKFRIVFVLFRVSVNIDCYEYVLSAHREQLFKYD